MTPSPDRSETAARAVLSALGIEACWLTPLVPGAQWSATPRSYRATTADGSQFKVRIGRRTDAAARAARLGEELADARVHPPLGRVGRVTVERWIDGLPLSSIRLRAPHIDDAADLLVAIHRFGDTDGGSLPRRGTGSVRARFERQLVELAAAGRVSGADASTLADIVRRGLPASATWGLMHGDFCGENLVLDTEGSVVSIDHELLGRGFLEYDLARSWYRWPMPPWAHQRFERRYRSALDQSPPSRQTWRAWQTVATVKGVHLRHRRGMPSDRGLAALRVLVA